MCDKDDSLFQFDTGSPVCKDCAHYLDDEYTDECKQGPYKRDLVSGHIHYHSCFGMRQETGRCGPKGTLYQKKPKHDFVDRLIAWFHG